MNASLAPKPAEVAEPAPSLFLAWRIRLQIALRHVRTVRTEQLALPVWLNERVVSAIEVLENALQRERTRDAGDLREEDLSKGEAVVSLDGLRERVERRLQGAVATRHRYEKGTKLHDAYDARVEDLRAVLRDIDHCRAPE